MINKIIERMRAKGVSDERLQAWLNEQAEQAEQRGDYDVADTYRTMANAAAFQREDDADDRPRKG